MVGSARLVDAKGNNMLVSDVNIQPNRTGLPGIASLESIVGALLTFGLVACSPLAMGCRSIPMP